MYLVRHGQTEFNLERRHHGRLDSPLTEQGREQARRAGETLATLIAPRDSVIFSSPLGSPPPNRKDHCRCGRGGELNRRRSRSHGDWNGIGRRDDAGGDGATLAGAKSHSGERDNVTSVARWRDYGGIGRTSGSCLVPRCRSSSSTAYRRVPRRCRARTPGSLSRLEQCRGVPSRSAAGRALPS
jgi:Histidine phosphatase superfamily (branch 1)